MKEQEKDWNSEDNPYLKDKEAMEVDIKKLRKKYRKVLDHMEEDSIEIPEDEIYFLHNQFTSFATMQLLYMTANRMFDTKKESADFLRNMVDSFIQDLKTNFLRGIELHELKQESSIMSKIFGKEILSRGNDYSRKHTSALLEKFETHIKKILNIKPPEDWMPEEC